MATKVWGRNPQYFIRECIEEGVTSFTWNAGYLHNRKIDPDKFARLYFPTGGYEYMVVDEVGRRAAVVCQDCTRTSPCESYPVWLFGDAWDDLKSAVIGTGVVVGAVPPTSAGRSFLRALGEMQDANPKSFVHLHGSWSFRDCFGFGIGSVDLQLRENAAIGKVHLPNGAEVTENEARAEWGKWIRLVGMYPRDLKDARSRCIFNLRSAKWASVNFRKNVKFLVRDKPINPDAIEFDVPLAKRILLKNVVPVDGDRFLCDACSLKNSCRYFRQGSVCTVPDSEVSDLAEMFNTRDSDTLIAGLGKLLEIQMERMGKGMAIEDENEVIDPEVSKLGGMVFEEGVKLAKLIDPTLDRRGGATNNILNVASREGGSVSGTSARELMAAISKELEARGVAREDITPEMIEKVFNLPERDRDRALAEVAGD